MSDSKGVLLIVRVIRIACLIVTSSTFVTMMTPNKTDDLILQNIRNIINILAGNFGSNVNLYDNKRGIPEDMDVDPKELNKIMTILKQYQNTEINHREEVK